MKPVVTPVASPAANASSGAVSLYDARPFFEKALQYGVQNRIIGAPKLAAIRADAPKGMVQIARYFGSEFLQPELEKARDRLINLVSLHLQSATGGDVRQAAELLSAHSFLSRSKAGSDMLKALIAMPQNSHFGMSERRAFSDAQIPLLAKWSLKSLADYQAELAKRQQVEAVMEAAVWLAEALGLDEDALEEAGKDAEAVIRTALLALSAGLKKMPDWVGFEKLVKQLRSQAGPLDAAPAKKTSRKPGAAALSLALPRDLPAELVGVVQAVLQSVRADLPKIQDAAQTPRQLFERTPSFVGRYFWVEDALAEIDQLDRSTSDAWQALMGGHSDDGSLLTLLLTVSAGAKPQTLLTEKAAASVVRKIQKNGFKPELALAFLAEHAPVQYQHDYEALWTAFVQEARGVLTSDAVGAHQDALALLGRECNIR